jgi:PBSX family phage terminase large subunit|nr:MAG TPA: large terminase [Caudoviricetes sp.]
MALGEKQLQILQFRFSDYSYLICDGAVRSGKTSLMMVGFVDDAMTRFNGRRFGICGKTVDSATKNIVQPYMAMQYAQKSYRIKWSRTDKTMTVSKGGITNVFEVFGGKDESSYALIQGRTLAGCLIDEVVLQPRSFVDQAMIRCSVTGAKVWFSCNPAAPSHWFYTDWIKKADKGEINAKHIHFVLRDNPGLSEETIQRYEKSFSGVFYQRYVLGEWVAAEGLVYPFFSAGQDTYLFHGDASHVDGQFYVSIDYGTHNPCSMGLWVIHNGKALRIKESYFDSRAERVQRTDEEHYAELERLTKGYYIQAVVVDPSAASFIETIRRHGRYLVVPADNDVLNGIRCVASLMQAGLVIIHESCAASRREFGLYSWDDKAKEDRVVKENDHAMDDIRYFCYTILAPMIRWADWRRK